MVDALEKLKINITLRDAVGEERSITSLKSLNLLIEKELPFWQEAISNFPGNNQLSTIKNSFQNAANQLDAFKQNLQQWDDNLCNQKLQELTSSITQLLRGGIFSDTPFAQAFIDAIKIGPLQAQVFWSYVTNHSKGKIPNTEIQFLPLEGAFLGYEYMQQDESAITKRRDSEKRSLAAMRKTLADRTDEVISETDIIQKKLITDTEEFKTTIDQWKEITTSDLDKQRDDFFTNAASRLLELEALYTEKLKLEKPAAYWRERARQFRNSGRGWGVALVASTIGSGAVFAWLFSEWLTSGKVIEKFSAQHWQGIILLAAVLSLTAFLIRTFGKLTFSAFHLQRDAEEREQLAYVYLALAKETEFSDESRKIVLQALFSRTETGLLSGDHGPTMPGATEVISKIK